jgi:hypothetical protein
MAKMNYKKGSNRSFGGYGCSTIYNREAKWNIKYDKWVKSHPHGSTRDADTTDTDWDALIDAYYSKESPINSKESKINSKKLVIVS